MSVTPSITIIQCSSLWRTQFSKYHRHHIRNIPEYCVRYGAYTCFWLHLSQFCKSSDQHLKWSIQLYKVYVLNFFGNDRFPKFDGVLKRQFVLVTSFSRQSKFLFAHRSDVHMGMIFHKVNLRKTSSTFNWDKLFDTNLILNF